MSPRRTKALHEFGYRHHLAAIILVGFESCDLCSESALVVESGGSVNQ